MHPFLSFLIRMGVSVPSVIVIWLISFFGINNPFGLSTVLSLAGGGLIYGLVAFYTNARFLKKNELTRKEYRYIKKNLDEAKQKISRLHKTLFAVRHLPSLKERVELLRIIRKIYSLTKKEPRRFYLAERFYFSHLDSVLELTEKYAFLSSQPKKNRELEHSLHDTRETLSDLCKLVENDLYHILEDDLEDLNFEIDVAKYSIKNVRDSKIEQSGYGHQKNSKANTVPGSPKNTVEDKNKVDSVDEVAANGSDDPEENKSAGPRYFINTKIEDIEAVKIPINETRETRYKDKNRRFPE